MLYGTFNAKQFSEIELLWHDDAGNLDEFQFFLLDMNYSLKGNPSIGDDTTTSRDKPLPQADVQEIPDDEIETVLDEIAKITSFDREEVKKVTSADIKEKAYEPTQQMKEEVGQDNYEFAAKLHTINFESEGLYMFDIILSDSLKT